MVQLERGEGGSVETPIFAPSVAASPSAAANARSLVLRCQAGDRAAFREIVVLYQRAVFACLSRMLGRGPHVDDLAQETFLRAYQALARFDVDGPAKLLTWLLTIATRAALDHRKRHRANVVPLEHADHVGTRATPETARTQRELGEALERAVRRLGDEQRMTLVLVEMHGLTLAEVATAMECPEATVKTRLFRAREKMRAELAPEWSAP